MHVDSRSHLTRGPCYVATEAGAVHALDARTGRDREAAIEITSADLFQIAVSPDGRLLAAGDWTGNATLWDLRTHERVGDAFPKVPGLVPQVAFEPNGRLLLTELTTASEGPSTARRSSGSPAGSPAAR